MEDRPISLKEFLRKHLPPGVKASTSGMSQWCREGKLPEITKVNERYQINPRDIPALQDRLSRLKTRTYRRRVEQGTLMAQGPTIVDLLTQIRTVLERIDARDHRQGRWLIWR